MFCNQCGKQNPDNSRFCNQCGYSFINRGNSGNSRVSSICSKCGATMTIDIQTQEFTCPHCGAKDVILESDKVKIERMRYNSQIEADRMQYENKVEMEKMKNKDFYIVMLGCVGVMFFIGIFCLLMSVIL